MTYYCRHEKGLSVVELMIAIAIGLFITTAFLTVVLSQNQTYKTTASQGFVQNTENAITTLVAPYIRGAGFAGCSTVIDALSNLKASSSAPLGRLGTAPAVLMGYQANTAMVQHNAPNSTTATNWTPALDATLVGNVEPGNDVLVVLGPVPGSTPVGVTAYTQSSNAFSVRSSAGVTVGQYASISDCSKTSIFQVTGVSGSNIAHVSGGGPLANASNTLAVNYPVGSQFIPMQQTAFFVGQGLGGVSSLMIATLNGSTWTISPLVPGIDVMKVMYGIGTNNLVTQYVSASAVTNWAQVYAVRLGFLVEGQAGSGSPGNVNPTQFTILGQTVITPADNRLRHVFEISVNVRNGTS